jgi:hypothetical protein
MGLTMNEPTIICPDYKREIKLTESLAAPLIETTRLRFEHAIAEKEAEMAKREAAIHEQIGAIEKAKETIDEQISQKLRAAREMIISEEAKKARLLFVTDIEHRAKEVADLQEVLKDRDNRLAEAHKAQVDLLRKQRELDDAKAELDFTVEKKVQESLIEVRDKATQEAEERLKSKVLEKEEQIVSMQCHIDNIADNIADKEAQIVKREAAICEEKATIKKAQGAIDEQVSEKLKAEREKIIAEEAKKARLILEPDIEQKAREVAALQEVLKDRDIRLAEAQKAQVELLRKQRELDDAKRELDLIVEKKVQESLTAIRDKAKQEAEEGLRLKVAEKEQQIASMQHHIEELKRRAEQGSQQLQGEVFELEIESLLQDKFPQDLIDPVPKGEFGGDVLQSVKGPLGQQCGSILWESKRTKNWSDAWLPKLRDNLRAAKADIALLVATALPKGVNTFDLIEGVWVTDTRCAIPVAVALRQSLIELNAARQASQGQQTKMEMIYQYLTGPRFRHRVEAIVEKFSDMQDDLDKESKDHGAFVGQERGTNQRRDRVDFRDVRRPSRHCRKRAARD